ncbi:MAG: PorV/PorQ family protein [bacterium]
MRTHLKKIVLILAMFTTLQPSYAQLFPNLGGQRVGTSTAQFLKIGIGARALGMGESYVAIANDAEALYWNPAGISQFETHDFFFAHIDLFIDIKIDYAGAVFHLNPTNSIGIFFSALNTGDMMETTEFQPFGTGRYFNYGDLLAGITYARNMTDKFSFGITTKYFQETLAELTMSSVLFDLGTYYKTGWKTTRFAVSVTNFGPEIAPSGHFYYKNLNNEQIKVSKFQKFTPPIIFRIGVAADPIQLSAHKLTTSIQLNHPNDNTENLNIGIEYWWNNLLAVRTGYITGRMERDISFGIGLNVPVFGSRFRFDYSSSDFGRLGYVNQFAMHLLF